MLQADKNKCIEQEFDKILHRLRKREHFALARYGDGEMQMIMHGKFNCKQWQVDRNTQTTGPKRRPLQLR